jgi:hypothetical protein
METFLSSKVLIVLFPRHLIIDLVLIRIVDKYVSFIEESHAPSMLQPSSISAIEDLHLITPSSIDHDPEV